MDDPREDREPEAVIAHSWQGGRMVYLYNLMNAGQWVLAVQELGQQIAEDPEDEELHKMMGRALRNLGKFAESEKHLKKAVTLAPEDDEAFVELALTYLEMNRAGLADDMVRQALRLNPENEISWIIMGQLSLHYDDTPQALRCADQIKRLNPESTQAMEIRTRALAQADGAMKLPAHQQIQEYHAILEVDPENDSALMHLGVVYFDELKDYDRAEECFRAALQIDPMDKICQKLLIKTLRKKDLVLKLLWVPYLPVEWILKLYSWAWRLKWPIIPLFLIGKYLIIVLVLSALIFFTIFWPVAKMYEYLTIADLHRKMGRVTLHRGPLARLHKASFALRFSCFLVGLVLFWSCIGAFFVSEATRGSVIFGVIILVVFGTFALIALSWGAVIYQFIRGKIRARKNRDLP
jgi:tetratricopeptide (TPR) repeat protein